uniref:G_PROTEIN_RECEP_F1_2 domain-containing protein n=1 Tax=Panagrellus redivivus TaxID=6233 RepID=A0A7E4V9B4_PANRE
MLKAVEYMLYVAFGLNMILNLFLLYIVKRFTSRTMKMFGDLIIQSIIIDIVASVLLTMVQLTVESKDGIVFFGSQNPWLPLPGKWQCSPVSIFAVAFNVSFTSVPLQAMYRYVIIVRKHKVPSWCPLLVYAAVALFIAGTTFSLPFLADTNSHQLQKLQSMEFWRGENTQVLCAVNIFSWPVILYLMGLTTLETSGILALLWFTNRLNATLNNVQMHFSPKTKQVHKEMTRKLYAQAAIPSITIVILVFICAGLFLMPNYYGGLFVLLILPLPWIVVINPLVTFCCIKQYRSVAIAILQGRCAEIKSNMSISPQKVTTVMGSRSFASATVTK